MLACCHHYFHVSFLWTLGPTLQLPSAFSVFQSSVVPADAWEAQCWFPPLPLSLFTQDRMQKSWNPLAQQHLSIRALQKVCLGRERSSVLDCPRPHIFPISVPPPSVECLRGILFKGLLRKKPVL